MDKKKALCSEVASAIRKVQKQSVLYTKTSSDNSASEQELQFLQQQLSVDVELFCGTLEAVFLHELKNSKGILWRNVRGPPEPSFWLFIDPMVPDEIKMQLLALRNSESNVRKCRSWVRLMLAKNLLISFMEDLQRHPGLLASHYEGGALLRDLEQSEIVVGLLRGLVVLPLDYDHANSKLDTWDPSVLALAGVWEGPGGVVNSRGTTSPHSIVSPAQSSPSLQRVSPPTSDFDFEGVHIIGTALDHYSRKKASASFSDSQLISQEITGQMNLTPPLIHTQRGKQGSVSTGSGSNVSLVGSEMEGQVKDSYGAMLLDYAKRTEPSGSTTGTASSRMIANAGVLRNGNGNELSVVERNRDPLENGGSELHGVLNGANYSVALSLNYEIISSDGSLVESGSYQPHQQQKSVMMEHLDKLVNEKGLDSQKYRCAGCQRDIGLIFGQAKLCKFNGQHYCFDCHRDEERIIPARVLFNWDFRLHKVCLASCEFLDSVELSPVLDVEKTNKALYRYIPTLEEAMKLRLQARSVKDYLEVCKGQDVLDNFRRRLKSSHICDDIHKYSLKDLIDVNSGTFNERLKKLVKSGKKHVKQCPLCSQKGFICEVCHDPQVIYPFDLEDTSQCSMCKSVYHKLCHPEKGSCPKCLRIRRRANSLSDSS